MVNNAHSEQARNALWTAISLALEARLGQPAWMDKKVVPTYLRLEFGLSNQVQLIKWRNLIKSVCHTMAHAPTQHQPNIIKQTHPGVSQGTETGWLPLAVQVSWISLTTWACHHVVMIINQKSKLTGVKH